MNTDLTTGNTSRLLWAFSIPMLISVVFQQFYNIADSIIAGRFIGEQALAAVGASYPITMIFMAVAIGSSIGCTVVVSQLFGSKHYAMLKTAVGTICCAGAIKLNTFGVTCMTTLSNGLSSFTAQNLGAGRKDRVQEGFRAGAKMGILVSLPFVLVYFFFSEAAMGLFMKSESAEAIAAGAMFLKIVTPFYFVVSTKVMCDGVLRGGSAMLYFMTTTFTDLVLRVVLAFVFAIGFGLGSTGIWLSWPFGWSISCILSYVFYRKKPWEKRSYDTL